MKGLTTQPLKFRVARKWYGLPGVLALMEAGHTVLPADENSDLELTEAAGWTEDLFVAETKKDGSTYYPYLDAAVTRARARRRKK